MSTFCRRRAMARWSCICSSSRSRHVTFRSSTCLRCCQAHSTGFRSGAYAGSASTHTPRPALLARNSLTAARRWIDEPSQMTSSRDENGAGRCGRRAVDLDTNPTRSSGPMHDRLRWSGECTAQFQTEEEGVSTLPAPGRWVAAPAAAAACSRPAVRGRGTGRPYLCVHRVPRPAPGLPHRDGPAAGTTSSRIMSHTIIAARMSLISSRHTSKLALSPEHSLAEAGGCRIDHAGACTSQYSRTNESRRAQELSHRAISR